MFHPLIMVFKMVQWLSNKFCLFVLFALGTPVFVAQVEEITPEYNDYKNPDQFYKFHNRAKVVAAWQINKLKEGALVVRLKTNKALIDALLAKGNEDVAKQKIAETYIINKNTLRAYVRNFTFCKLYFMYSSASDSLLNGSRSGFFLDTNMVLDKTIELKESYYLIAERDYAYNSSIGFVKQDSAKFIKEGGNPVREMGAVIKNCYGHQLKNPFPYYVKDKTFVDYGLPYYVIPDKKNNALVWAPAEDTKAKQDLLQNYPDTKDAITVKIKKQFNYKNISSITQQLNQSLESYFKYSIKPEENKIGPTIKPYLY